MSRSLEFMLREASMSRRAMVAACAATLASASIFGLTSCAEKEPAHDEGLRGESSSGPAEESQVGSLAVAIPEGSLLVTEYAGNTLAVVDPSTGVISSRIGIGQNPVMCVLAGERVYVGSSGGGEVHSLDIRSGAVSSIAAGVQPLGLSFCEDRGRLYSADYLSGTIHAIDVGLNSVVGATVLSLTGFRNRTDPPDCCREGPGRGRMPVSLCASGDGRMLYVANYGTYDIARIDLETGEEIEAFDGVVGPRTVAISRDDQFLLLAGVGGEEDQIVSDLYIVDRLSGERVAEVAVGPGVADVCELDGEALLATSRDDGRLVKISYGSWDVVGSVDLKAGVEGICLSPDGSTAYVISPGTGDLFAVDAANLEVVWTASGLANPKDAVILP